MTEKNPDDNVRQKTGSTHGMSDAESADDERMEAPDYSTQSETVGRADGYPTSTKILVWLLKRIYLVIAILILAGVVVSLVFDVSLSRSETVVIGTMLLSGFVFGYPVGSKAVELMGGPQVVWIVDVDLLNMDGAGIYRCPSPRWSEEWDVSEYSLWWATPNLGFGKNLNLEEKTVVGVWPGTLPEPVLMRALTYLRYNREELQERAESGERIRMNAWAMIRSGVVGEMEKVVQTFESGSLPDENKTFLEEVDKALDRYGLEEELPTDQEESGFGEDGDPSPENGFKFEFNPQEESADA